MSEKAKRSESVLLADKKLVSIGLAVILGLAACQTERPTTTPVPSPSSKKPTPESIVVGEQYTVWKDTRRTVKNTGDIIEFHVPGGRVGIYFGPEGPVPPNDFACQSKLNDKDETEYFCHGTHIFTIHSETKRGDGYVVESDITTHVNGTFLSRPIVITVTPEGR